LVKQLEEAIGGDSDKVPRGAADKVLRHGPSEELAGAMVSLGWRESADRLRASRCAMAGRLSRVDGRVARRVLHAWHVTAMPPNLGSALSRHVAITFMPRVQASCFEPHPALVRLASDIGTTPEELFAYPSSSKTVATLSNETAADLAETLGHAWGDIDDVRVVALVRGSGPGNGSWTLRVFSCWIDELTHQLVVGEPQPTSAGHTIRHVEMVQSFGTGSRLFQCAQAEKQPPWVASTARAGLDLVYAMELAASVRDGVSSLFDWPRPWVGVAAEPDTANFQVEAGDGLKRDALRWMRTWLARGRPAHPAFLAHLRDRADLARLAHVGSTWDEVESVLGRGEAQALLEAAWSESFVTHEGLAFLPLDYFLPGSPQRPLLPSKCKRIVLSFGPRLMGREIPTPSGTVSDLLQPRAQVIRVPRAMSTRDGLVGQHATARWDLSLRR
jgi:hypothetical protein